MIVDYKKTREVKKRTSHIYMFSFIAGLILISFKNEDRQAENVSHILQVSAKVHERTRCSRTC
jgi:hypothetical protein